MFEIQTDPVNFFQWGVDAGSYLLDHSQRSVLYWDILRKRGNNYLSHLEAGQPPVLIFDYEMIMDGRNFERPVNYALLGITDRRQQRDTLDSRQKERRQNHKNGHKGGEPARPILVIDPRAGHGPGIGGSKLNSQIGVALDMGHPVYFVTFYTDPEPGQTIGDVSEAEIRFLEEVVRRHPNAPKPAVMGNCQAGWAAALIGADRPDVTGPLVLNGSPLSYWGGIEGANPMRYRGGLCGGVWMTSLMCDLGNGRFDGAHLVSGFEDLNPGNTLWSKQYYLYSNVDTEENRYLDFEKWWGGFFKLNAEEIHFIVDSLFVGNTLEQGNLRMDNGKLINLKNLTDPILVFASSGDNITPPPQALNWIYKVYGSVDEIKRCGQVIIYMVHADIGHLGIFVSGKVAKKEHRNIIGCMDMLDYLSPGLYEMVIEGEPTQPWLDDYQVRFEERSMDDLLTLDDGLEDEEAFYPVRAVSQFNDKVYRTYMQPWIQSAVNENFANWFRELHPLRVQRYTVSDQNLFCWPLPWMAALTKAYRMPVAADNVFVKLEKIGSETIEKSLDLYRDVRDRTQEVWFKSLYNNPFVKHLFESYVAVGGGATTGFSEADQKRLERYELQWAHRTAGKGGFTEAVIRIMIAVTGANHVLDKRQFQAAQEIIQTHPLLKTVTPSQYKIMVKEQARILQLDQRHAFNMLTRLLPEEKERKQAMDFALKIAISDHEKSKEETHILNRIRSILNL
jgi:pimeloyl-ACP methyl ester carboxylesterase/tellurite resistance protein